MQDVTTGGNQVKEVWIALPSFLKLHVNLKLSQNKQFLKIINRLYISECFSFHHLKKKVLSEIFKRQGKFAI